MRSSMSCRFVAVLVGFATLSACSDGPSEPLADGGTGIVIVSVIDDRVMATGDVQVPGELYGLFATTVYGIAGLNAPAEYEPGMFAYHGVPYTPLMIRMGVDRPYDHVITSERLVDCGRTRMGRWATSSGPGTVLRLVLDGLSPWEASDDLRLVSANGHASWHLWNDPALVAGVTSVTTAQDFEYLPLLDSDRGDDLTVYQTEQLAGDPYFRLTRAGSGEVHMVDHTTTSTTISLAAAPEETHAIDLRRSEFLALGGDVNPRATEYGTSWLSIESQPGGATHGPFSVDSPFTYQTFLSGEWSYRNPRLLLGFFDTDFAGDVSFGNPFSSFWRPYVYVETTWYTDYLAPGTTMSYAGNARVRVWVALDELNGGPITPLVGPPRDVLVNGQAAAQDLTGVGVLPVISWSPPALGVPTSYEVTIVLLEPSDENTFDEPIARYLTTELSVTVTRDMMVLGQLYFATVTAVYQPGVDRLAHPFRESFPKGTADAITGVMMP